MLLSVSDILKQAHRDYARDGVALVRGLFVDWVDRLLPRALELVGAAARETELTGERPGLKGLWQREPAFRAFVFDSPAAVLAAAVTGSDTVRLALDQIWAKAPRSRHLTRWHFDRPAWPVEGMMLPSVWVALTKIAPENSLEFLAGSHLTNRDPQSSDFLDIEMRRNAPDTRILAFALDAGDAFVFHPMTYHGCRGNTDAAWRVALTTRWLGDDIRYDPTRAYLDEGLTFAECIPGRPLDGPAFPRVDGVGGFRDGA